MKNLKLSSTLAMLLLLLSTLALTACGAVEATQPLPELGNRITTIESSAAAKLNDGTHGNITFSVIPTSTPAPKK
jgi:hypothetical protein